jgi:uncharacterized protein with ParB-like and HNH nuclease domain
VTKNLNNGLINISDNYVNEFSTNDKLDFVVEINKKRLVQANRKHNKKFNYFNDGLNKRIRYKLGENMSKNLELKSISEILDKHFFIPSYQRGYRWGEQQIIDLLKDILEFASDKKMKGFYCLQPIVVKKETIKINEHEQDQYRVIDGQQRLTTIYIILKYLSDARKYIFPSNYKKIYSILYETRQEKDNNSYEFLEDIKNIDSVDNKNIDFHYMSSAYITIKKWFENEETRVSSVINALLNNDYEEKDGKKIDVAKNVRIIWYEIEEEDEISVFTRLNIGKIPLTNSELIKALFVLNIKEKNERLKLTTEWDNIEYTLQNSKFFAFLNDSEYDKATKIEFIFDLIADLKKNDVKIENLRTNDIKYSFYIFNDLISNGKKSDKEENSKELWKTVKKYFRIFNELYNSNIYYHLVGYLTNYKSSKKTTTIKEIIKLFEDNNKNEFKLKLNNLIKKTLPKNKKLDDLNYKDDSKDVYNILFLFNVISTLNSEYTRYPFDKHKSEQWSLEHIHAQNSQQIKKDEHKIKLLESELLYVKDEKKVKKIQSLLDIYEVNKKIDKDTFEDLQNDIFSDSIYGDGASVNLHTINNLALLSGKDNSALNNSVFPAKRDKIIELDSNGSFIPIGTKNVFLKYYSNDVKEAVQWNKEDMEAYFNAINKVLEIYLGDTNE